ncbi:hypothetical protein SAMN04515620_10534 [Collimonas sp. OK607]|uniref:hypothetical protein n=1 Tax=Collimonas sp. OK607 TaxID=1798194 RepID=UPI0008EFE45C|nr:hypothetical protein [Collimonas sp. OK607]SFA84866.1 hypothetical protein SAMN04515620_10534 [Collimonas sp. OK607]
MKKIIALLFTMIVATGCSKPQDVVLSPDPAKWGQEVSDAAQKLSEDDRKLLAGYAMRSAIGTAFGGKGIVPGTTIGTAIAEQKQWILQQQAEQAEQEALKQKLVAEQLAFQKTVAEALTVTVLEKKVLPKDYHASRYSDYQTFKLGLQNKSGKDIEGVAGRVQFYDIFDKEVYSIRFSFDEGVKAGATAVWEGGLDINQFNDGQKNLANLAEGKYTTRFFPSAIVFADGTKLKVSD